MGKVEDTAKELAEETLELACLLEKERASLALEVAAQLRKDLLHLKLLIMATLFIAIAALFV